MNKNENNFLNYLIASWKCYVVYILDAFKTKPVYYYFKYPKKTFLFVLLYMRSGLNSRIININHLLNYWKCCQSLIKNMILQQKNCFGNKKSTQFLILVSFSGINNSRGIKSVKNPSKLVANLTKNWFFLRWN